MHVYAYKSIYALNAFIYIICMYILHILLIWCTFAYNTYFVQNAYIEYVRIFVLTWPVGLAKWLDRVSSKMIYERKSKSQVLYVLPISHILVRLPWVHRGHVLTACGPGGSQQTCPGRHVTQSPTRAMGAENGSQRHRCLA